MGYPPYPPPDTPPPMDSENVSTKRSEPDAPKIDLTFDSPENPKTEKQPKKEADPVKPFPLDPMIGSAMASSSSASGATGLPASSQVPNLPMFRGQGGVLTVQPPANSQPYFAPQQPSAYGPMTAHGPQLHTTYAPAHAHYNPQAYQANVADNRVNAQIADNR